MVRDKFEDFHSIILQKLTKSSKELFLKHPTAPAKKDNQNFPLKTSSKSGKKHQATKRHKALKK